SHSHTTLCELELISLSRSSNALKRAKEEMDEAVAQREVAGVVRWLMENREVLLEAARRTILQQAKGPELFESDAKADEARPLAHHSVRECDAHLEIHRQRDARDRAKKGIKPGTQGRQPGTIKALKEANEQRKASKRGAS